MTPSPTTLLDHCARVRLLQVITLSAPYVPVAPGEEWWNQQLVKRVRESMASESAVTGIDHPTLIPN